MVMGMCCRSSASEAMKLVRQSGCVMLPKRMMEGVVIDERDGAWMIVRAEGGAEVMAGVFY